MEPVEDKSDKSKRMIVLGVVDTSGMKASGSARKRRWDQPPEEGEEVDGAAPPKVVVKETAAVKATKPEESLEDEMADVFYDTSETLLEDVPLENNETAGEPLKSDSSSPIESFAEVSSTVPDEPERVSSSSCANDLTSTPEQLVEEGKVQFNTAPNEAKAPVVKGTKSQDKKNPKVVAPVKISDSLKAIQFCYDEDDSNSSEGSDSDCITAVIPVVSDSKTDDNTDPTGVLNKLAAEVIIESSLDPDAPKKVSSELKDEVVIEQSLDSLPSEGDVILEESSVLVKSPTKEKSRSPTPVLADEEDEDSAQRTEVIEVSTIEETALVVEDATISVEIDASALITNEPSVQAVLHGNSDVSQAILPEGKNISESELIVEAAELEDTAKIEDVVTNKLSLYAGGRQLLDESRSPDISQSDSASALKGLEKPDECFNEKSLMYSLDAPSEQSNASKPIVEASSVKERTEQGQNNMISMDNSQNCCVSFDDLSNLDKQSSKSPELDLRYTDSEDSNDIKHPNPEVTMHFASVRTQDSVLTPDNAQEEADSPNESALAIDALITANPELEDKNLDFEVQTESQSQTTMEMLDSLVRRSSEDDPSRLTGGGGLLSEDSLINEINQLPDQEDDYKNRESSKSSVKDNATAIKDGAQTVRDNTSELPQHKDVVTEAEVRAPNADIPEPPKKTTVPARAHEMEKSETCTSVEEELSQGADDEESKNVTVSSANILEVIFGSEPKSTSYHTISSLKADTDLKAEKKIVEKLSSNSGSGEALTGVTEKPVNDSKLQLKNEDFEMGSAEIVAVDPTKSLSGDDSDEEEVSSSKLEDVEEKVTSTQLAQEPEKVEAEHIEAADDTMQLEQLSGLKVKLSKTKLVAPKSSKADDDFTGLEMDVDESSTSIDDEQELFESRRTQAVPMEVENRSTKPQVEKRGLAVDDAKHAEALSSSVKEPVPVLIIKKQSLPSKKLGETVETMLTCSPKSIEGFASSPSRKPPNESLHVDTVQEVAAETSSPRHSPITLRIYKDNLTVKTDLDSPKRNKSPLSSEFKSELSPRPGVTDNVSPQNKQLEFTLKIAKDANTNQPKATMSPKHVASPTSVWKSEVHVDSAEKPARSVSAAAAEKQLRIAPVGTADKSSRPTTADTGTELAKQRSSTPTGAAEKDVPPSTEAATEVRLLSTSDTKAEEAEVKPTPTRGRGRGRGTARRTPAGRGRRGGVIGQRGKIDEPIIIPDEDASEVKIKMEVEESPSSPAPCSLGLQMTDAFKKMMSQEKASIPQPEIIQPVPHTTTVTEVLTPVVKKRGRPRKSVQHVLPVPEEIVPIKTEPAEPYTPADVSGGEAGDDTPSGRPKRTCRGRTKPIVVKKKRGGAAGSVAARGASTPLPIDPADIKQEGTPSVATAASAAPKTEAVIPDTPTTGAIGASSPEKSSAHGAVPTPSDSESPVLCHKCGTEMRETIRGIDRDGNPRRVHRCPRGGCQVYRFPHLTYEISEAARGRGNFKRPTPDRNTLSEKELAELQKIEAKKEKLRLDRIAKYEAKKAKKLAKKLKDEERRKRQAQEKAEKAAAAAPQVFEEETRMSAPDSSSRGHTPAPNRIIMMGDTMGEESQNSITTPGDSNRGNKKGRMEISIGDLDCLVKEVKVDDLAEYQWQGSELYMIQEQVSLYLGVKSFKRKYPGLKRRTIEAEERTFLEDSRLVPKSMCDLGITAVSSSEILDIMFQDFPDKYEEFRKHVREKQAREASYKQKAAIGMQKKDGTKVEPREQALEAVASWNANLNRERREERKCALDLQTFTVHYPKLQREHMAKPTPKVGLYPVAVIPGQFCDFYKKYTPNELMYFPINTVVYGPLKPNERQKDGSEDGSATESSSSSSSSSSSGESSSESESEGEDPPKCTMCNGTRKKNKDSLPEVLLSCIQCKTCYHPSCKEFTPEMTPHLVKYEWQCTACKKCAKCRDPNLKDKIMCCQLCDRGYHLTCIGLKKMPEGRWHCSVCAYCSSCGSRNPGGSDWQHEFKKGEKGTKVYQRTLCTPCFKLWRKGKYCQLCSKCHSMKPEEDPNLIQCNSCDRWLHKECYGTKYGIQNKLLSTSSIQCDICVERIQNSSISGINRSLIKV